MACINDTTLSRSAQKLLTVADPPATTAQLAQRAQLALFQVRSGIRELIAAGFLIENEARYRLSDAGRVQLYG